MAGLCEGGNEPPGSLKANSSDYFNHLFLEHDERTTERHSFHNSLRNMMKKFEKKLESWVSLRKEPATDDSDDNGDGVIGDGDDDDDGDIGVDDEEDEDTALAFPLKEEHHFNVNLVRPCSGDAETDVGMDPLRQEKEGKATDYMDGGDW
ncbi:hypothetical protein ANN_26859 [Periplaneta americana]|uniref:Uncharacterized protein n=1 Tax=Periplaneta americana TaxID=6978 RepID=A0ABQ8RZF7_PERAM|nr:hypothetical protein ANN_26859 [Periplaneta americana]